MKTKVNLGGKKVTINTDRPKVANAVAALIEACATPEFKIGMILEHDNGHDYQLVSVKRNKYSEGRAYLINTDTGKARNSTKVVPVVKDADGDYCEDLPCQKDRFFDPDGDGEFLDI